MKIQISEQTKEALKLAMPRFHIVRRGEVDIKVDEPSLLHNSVLIIIICIIIN